MAHLSLNGTVTDTSRAIIAHDDRGFRFGDGLFETIALQDGVPYQWELHMSRLQAGLDALRIALPPCDLKAEARTLLHQSSEPDGFLRIQITRGVGSIGYRPTGTLAPLRLMEVLPPRPQPSGPIGLWQSRWQKPSPHMLPTDCKISQGIGPTLALLEAEENACFEALQLSANNELCEASSGNLFWLKDGMLHTPALQTGCLNGTTRAAIWRLWTGPKAEICAPIHALQAADAVFLSNCGWGVLPVASLKPLGWHWDHNAPALALIADALRHDQATHRAGIAHEWR